MKSPILNYSAFRIPHFALLFACLALPALAQEPESTPSPPPPPELPPIEVPADEPPPEIPPEPKWEGPPWALGLALKWDGMSLGGEGNTTRFSWTGLEVVHRMSSSAGIGAGLYFSSGSRTDLELSINGRYYWPLLNNLVHPYLGAQFSYLSQDNGGFSLALRPGLELHLVSWLQLAFFGLARYDIARTLSDGAFAGEQISLGVGVETRYAF